MCCRLQKLELIMSLPPPTQFRDKSLTMQAAIALACRELGISMVDHEKRECIAILMAPLIKSGPVSIDRLKTFSVGQASPRDGVSNRPEFNKLNFCHAMRVPGHKASPAPLALKNKAPVEPNLPDRCNKAPWRYAPMVCFGHSLCASELTESHLRA